MNELVSRVIKLTNVKKESLIMYISQKKLFKTQLKLA